MIPIAAVTAPVIASYLEPHQARNRKPTAHEDLLGDSIERAYAAGHHAIDDLLAYLNQAGPMAPNSQPWTPESFKAEMARLGV